MTTGPSPSEFRPESPVGDTTNPGHPFDAFG